MSKLPLLYVQGVNGSFAQRLMPEDQMRTVNDSTNDRWIVIGAHDALDQAEKRRIWLHHRCWLRWNHEVTNWYTDLRQR